MSYCKICKFRVDSDFAIPDGIYIISCSMAACSDKGGVEKKMTDNLKVKSQQSRQ
jgi:hypothetical protein